jgi:multidrug resistance efflux pump
MKLLRDALGRSLEQAQDRAELNADKHRLHALRSENCTLRLRIDDLEAQLAQMRATRGWKLLEKFRGWRRTVSGWLHPFSKVDEAEPRP